MREHKFERAPAAVAKAVARLVKKFHPEIEAAKLTFDICFCRAETDSNGDPTGPAIMHHGHAAAGLARITSLKERAMGRADAEISLDADQWGDWTAEQRDALLDHEINHFIPKKDALGAFLYDDLGRPKLTMRQHDYEFGWFTVIAERHGIASLEVQQATQMAKAHGQVLFPFMEPAKA
jgi:hypothetical protein